MLDEGLNEDKGYQNHLKMFGNWKVSQKVKSCKQAVHNMNWYQGLKIAHLLF